MEAPKGQVILITGASSGFGALSARALAKAGHTVYASMLDTAGQNAAQVKAVEEFSAQHFVDLRSVELDVTSDASSASALHKLLGEAGRIDVVVHNAGHMVFGPSEAFTPDQFARLYDINVLGTQRVNRATLPIMRRQQQGLLVWVSSTSTRGGTPPYLGPYFAAKAAMDSLAVTYAGELSRWGIETSIIVPGAYTSGTNHFVNAGYPADLERASEYEGGPYAGFADDLMKAQRTVVPPDANVEDVADAIVRVVGTPFGQRPFRVHVDPAQDGCEVVAAVADRMRRDFLRRIGMQDLLTVGASANQTI